MQTTSSTWKRLAVVAAIAALPAVAYANIENEAIYAGPYPVEFEGSDCSGVFGQGFENCKIPSMYDLDQSPIIIKFNTFEDEGVEFPTPPSDLIEINSIFPSIDGNEFRFECDDAECRTGTWYYDPNDALDPVISFYVAKGGSNFNLFNVEGPVVMGDDQQGDWSTPLGRGLSHMSFYDTTGIPDQPDPRVPEPTTLALLAAGLLGLGVAARRRRA